jgi:hypothetical protein
MKALIEHFCAQEDLATYDPYDVWKTPFGFRVKDLYNRRPRAGLVLAAVLGGLDNFFNNRSRWFYATQEYPIVRAMAALCLATLHRQSGNGRYLEFAARHLRWLVAHSCKGYSGPCWGLGFPHAVSASIVYDANTPFSTITPYVLEAFLAYREARREPWLDPVICGILEFFDRDLRVMEEDDEALATSYGPWQDRIVINAVAYTLYAYALLLPYASERRRPDLERKIGKLYRYIVRHQRSDGSWLYSPQGRSFVDCFHTCIVLKNLIKASRAVELADSAAVLHAGYAYLKRAFLDQRAFLFRRFSISNKPSVVRFDLYDNAEALNLALLTGDLDLADCLLPSILQRFAEGPNIYSQIDVLWVRRNKNTLRWAVMPLLYAMTQRIALMNDHAN